MNPQNSPVVIVQLHFLLGLSVVHTLFPWLSSSRDTKCIFGMSVTYSTIFFPSGGIPLEILSIAQFTKESW
jgi:hypothetical protein